MTPKQASFQLWGSDSLAPIAQHVAEWYMLDRPECTVAVVTNTTGRGLKALLDGTAQAAMASSAIPAEATRRANRQGRRLAAWVVAHDAMVVIVHPSNPLTGLSMDQLRDIYSGRITRWDELGAASAEIHAYAPEPSSGTASAWRSHVIGPRAIQSPRVRIVETVAMARAVARDPKAIGFVSGMAGDRGTRTLAVNGVEATAKTLRDGSYPLARDLSLVSDDPPSPALADFIRWFRRPDKGQMLVAGMGAAPVDAEDGASP